MSGMPGNHKCMADVSQNEQATRAIGHVLTRIRDDKHVGYYLGCGTQSFDLLTEAYATLTGREPAVIRDHFAPRNATNPREGID